MTAWPVRRPGLAVAPPADPARRRSAGAVARCPGAVRPSRGRPWRGSAGRPTAAIGSPRGPLPIPTGAGPRRGRVTPVRPLSATPGRGPPARAARPWASARRGSRRPWSTPRARSDGDRPRADAAGPAVARPPSERPAWTLPALRTLADRLGADRSVGLEARRRPRSGSAAGAARSMSRRSVQLVDADERDRVARRCRRGRCGRSGGRSPRRPSAARS